MAQFDLGANQFTFTGDRTHIIYNTDVRDQSPVGTGRDSGRLEYQGPEGNRTFFGKDITVESTSLGTMLTVTLKFNNDTGGLTLTLLIPRVFVNSGNTLTFETLAIKASHRGFIRGEGPELRYTIVPLLATACNAMQSDEKKS